MVFRKFLNFFLRKFSTFVSNQTDCFLAFNFYNRTYNLKKYPKYPLISQNYGIIIQGLVVTENNFTYQTICLYRQLYPNILIVLSTWEGTSKNFIKKVNQITNIKIILSKVPDFSGIKNINLQIESTKNALSYLQMNNCDFVLKTRTDQRLDSAENFLNYFTSLQKLFPNTRSYLKSKLIISSMNTYKDRFYGVSDMLMFGKIEDMCLYWSIKYDDKTFNNFVPENNPKYFMKQSTAEGYLVSEFMKRINWKPKWNKVDHKLFFKNYFISVDHDQIGHFWYKNNWWSRDLNKRQPNDDNYLTFLEWLTYDR